MKRSRRSLLAGGAGVCAATFLKWPANAAEFSYKMSVPVAVTEPMSSRALEAASRIYHQSNGRMEIKVYPSSILGGDDDTLEEVRLGALEFLELGIQVLANIVPVVGIIKVPFIFPNYETAWKVSDGPLGKYMRDAVAKANINLFEIWDGGFNNIYNNVRPIVSPGDLKGLKIRVPPGPVQVALLKTLGATAVPISYNQVYTSLQTHLIDGQITSTSFIESGKFYEVLKYASTTNHIWGGSAMIAGGDAWRRLPNDLRDMVDRNIHISCMQERKDEQHLDIITPALLKQHGMAVNQADTAAFRAELRRAGFYAQLRSTYGDEAWGILEKAVGPLS